MLLVTAPAALAHPERQAFFPDGNVGEVPSVRGKAAQVLTVCKSNSKRLIRTSFKGKERKTRQRLRQMKTCRFRHIQSGQPCWQRRDHPRHAGHLPREAQPSEP